MSSIASRVEHFPLLVRLRHDKTRLFASAFPTFVRYVFKIQFTVFFRMIISVNRVRSQSSVNVLLISTSQVNREICWKYCRKRVQHIAFFCRPCPSDSDKKIKFNHPVCFHESACTDWFAIIRRRVSWLGRLLKGFWICCPVRWNCIRCFSSTLGYFVPDLFSLWF